MREKRKTVKGLQNFLLLRYIQPINDEASSWVLRRCRRRIGEDGLTDETTDEVPVAYEMSSTSEGETQT